MEKRGMVRVKAYSSGKEIFDYVRICDLQRLIAKGYVVALWDIVPDIRQRKEKR
jgi:hypothetical protein